MWAGRHCASAAQVPHPAAQTARAVCSSVAWQVTTCADQAVCGAQAGAGRLLAATDLTGSTPAQLAAEKGHRFLAMYLDEAARKHARTKGCARRAARSPARRWTRAWAGVRRWRGGARRTCARPSCSWVQDRAGGRGTCALCCRWHALSSRHRASQALGIGRRAACAALGAR